MHMVRCSMEWVTHHFNIILWLHLCEALFCEGGKVGLYHHESATDALTFHSLCKGFYCFDANFVFIWVEHKNLQVQSSCLETSSTSMHASLLQQCGAGEEGQDGVVQ